VIRQAGKRLFDGKKAKSLIMDSGKVTTMKQITNKEFEEWQKYKAEKAKGHVLLPDTVRFICEANGYDAEKIGQHFLEILPKICPKEN